MRWIESQIPGHIRGYIVNYGHVELDFSMLMFTLGITLLCGLVFGFAPAFANSRLDVNHTLKETSGQTSGSKRGCAAPADLCSRGDCSGVVVLSSATVAREELHPFCALESWLRPGQRPGGAARAPETKYTEDSQFRNFSDEVLSRIRAPHWSCFASVASHVPFGGFARHRIPSGRKPLQPVRDTGPPSAAVSSGLFLDDADWVGKSRFSIPPTRMEFSPP